MKTMVTVIPNFTESFNGKYQMRKGIKGIYPAWLIDDLQRAVDIYGNNPYPMQVLTKEPEIEPETKKTKKGEN